MGDVRSGAVIRTGDAGDVRPGAVIRTGDAGDVRPGAVIRKGTCGCGGREALCRDQNRGRDQSRVGLRMNRLPAI